MSTPDRRLERIPAGTIECSVYLPLFSTLTTSSFTGTKGLGLLNLLDITEALTGLDRVFEGGR